VRTPTPFKGRQAPAVCLPLPAKLTRCEILGVCQALKQCKTRNGLRVGVAAHNGTERHLAVLPGTQGTQGMQGGLDKPSKA
jgi:hypothetical protein